MESRFFKRMNTQDLQCSVQSAGQFQLLVQDGEHHVNGAEIQICVRTALPLLPKK
jgi:hypothetical protein